MDIRLDGKVALVTGGGSGIGRATALAFAASGASVVVADIDEAGARGTLDRIERSGSKALLVHTDVSRETQCAAMVAAAVKAFSRLDIAFNNAGIMASYNEKLHESTEEDWDRLMAVNFKGVFLCMKHELRQMLAQGGGVIVNTASAVGRVGTPYSVTYPAAKHGVVGMTRCAALQYARSGIRINAVCPGLVETPITARMRDLEPGFDDRRANLIPMGRISSPEEIAQAVVWLASDQASYVTATSMLVDGGWVAE
jgi:NAD(P)-dependent dehydrogenase (short-subunit alcohol dehydrogenase family)